MPYVREILSIEKRNMVDVEIAKASEQRKTDRERSNNALKLRSHQKFINLEVEEKNHNDRMVFEELKNGRFAENLRRKHEELERIKEIKKGNCLYVEDVRRKNHKRNINYAAAILAGFMALYVFFSRYL